MNNTSTDIPLSLFIRYLGEQYLGLIKPEDIMNSLPDDTCIYRTKNMDNCWWLYVPTREMRLGASRLVGISKDSYKVVCDQMVGE